MIGFLNGIKERFRPLKYLADDYLAGVQRVDKVRRDIDLKSYRKVKVSSNSRFEHFIKLQTPRGHGIWKSTLFVQSLDREVDLVINRRNPYSKLHKHVERNWLLHIEPPGYIKKLRLNEEREMERYGKVFTSSPELIEKGGKYIASPPYVHWHLAVNSYTNRKDATVYDYDFLLNCDASKVIEWKEDMMSAVNSNISNLPGHKLRAEFITNLCTRGMKFNLFGHSYWSKYSQYRDNAPSGKWPAFLTSKYVLVIENEVSPYYWTEKFTDAILCFCIPIYYGSNRIGEYFPEGSYIPLDINKSSAFDDIQSIIGSDFYEKNLDKLLKARELVLTTHNLFNFINREMIAFNA